MLLNIVYEFDFHFYADDLQLYQDFEPTGDEKLSDYLSIADTETLVRALITSKLHSPPLRLTVILVG